MEKFVGTRSCIDIERSELYIELEKMGNPFAASLEIGINSVISLHLSLISPISNRSRLYAEICTLVPRAFKQDVNVNRANWFLVHEFQTEASGE